MERFHLIEDAAAVLHSRGLFRQAKVYRRGVGLYAAQGNGFVRLYGGGGTSLPNVTCVEFELPDGVATTADKFGKLELTR